LNCLPDSVATLHLEDHTEQELVISDYQKQICLSSLIFRTVRANPFGKGPSGEQMHFFPADIKLITVNKSTFTLNNGNFAVSGTVSYEPSSQTATFTPDDPLLLSNRYTVTTTPYIMDTVGNRWKKKSSGVLSLSMHVITTETVMLTVQIYQPSFRITKTGLQEADINNDGEANTRYVEAFGWILGCTANINKFYFTIFLNLCI
jgi:hypothetical protein